IPDATLVLLGNLSNEGREPWYQVRRRVLSRPNVRLLGWKPQQEIAAYSSAFDVCLIPYRVEHPFNRVCNPTKIMDYMGGGRPIVATGLPECLLHSQLFDVARTHEDFVSCVLSILERNSNDGRSALRHAYATQNSCALTVDRLLEWIV